MRTREELRVFVESLPIPAERRELLLVELEDHVFEEMAELESRGLDPASAERAAVSSLGPSEVLAARFAAVESGFAISVARARYLGLVRGLVLAVIFLGALSVDASAPAAPPSASFFALVIVSFLALWPWHAATRMATCVARAVELRLAGDHDRAAWQAQPASDFFALFVLSASAPFFLWLAAVALGIPLGAAESFLLRTCFGGLLVAVLAFGSGGWKLVFLLSWPIAATRTARAR